jgi:hypothetical protein
VEYDLDAEDEDWVERYGLGGSKLSDQKFERMLWVLELACAEAQEVLWNAAGELNNRAGVCLLLLLLLVCGCAWVAGGPAAGGVPLWHSAVVAWVGRCAKVVPSGGEW